MTYLARLSTVIQTLDVAPLVPFIADCTGVLWLAGNGGSAAVAQHWACDLSKAARRRVQALGCNTAIATAWANDTSYEHALAAEFTSLVRPGDRLICLSCSGTSPNIRALLQAATTRHIPAALISSALLREAPVGVVTMRVPSDSYGIIEDCFAALGHALTEALA